MKISGLLAVVVAVAACSGTSTTPQSSVSSTVQSSSRPFTSGVSTSVPPTRWTIAIDVSVSSSDGEAPFGLQVDSPVVVSDLAQPTTLSLRATANAPGLVVFRAEVFTTRLHGAGTLDVVGPGCPASYPFAESPTCSADPVMVPIGVSYNDLGASKPTGSVIASTAIPVMLITDALRSGTYHLSDDSGVWQPVGGQRPNDLQAFDVSIDFTVTGPA